MRRILSFCLFTLIPLSSAGQSSLKERYTADRPVIIVGDWDKPPYEFQNDKGEPTGSNIDVFQALMKQMGLPYKYILKEWGNAIKTFERGEADIILANSRRYQEEPYYYSRNIVNYNRIYALTLGDSLPRLSLRQLVEGGAVLKPSDYSIFYFLKEDSSYIHKIEFQSPKIAILGLLANDYKYFIWGEEPLRWKIKEFNMSQKGFVLNEVDIPISELHIIGRDKDLVEELDDQFSRLKQSGEIERINNKWLHPDRVSTIENIPVSVYIVLGVLFLICVFYILNRLAHSHVTNVMRHSSELNEMMYKALHMGHFHIMQYDIANDRLTNRYGNILPPEGMTLQEFTNRIHSSERDEFRTKMNLMLNGRERKTILDKRWNSGTEEEPQWLFLHGHAMVELDQQGKPAYIINTISDLTNDIEKEHNNHELTKKYERLSNLPSIAISFYDKDGWLIDLNDTMRELCGFDKIENERFFRQVCMFDVPLFRDVMSPNSHDEVYVCQHMLYPELNIDRYIEFSIQPLLNEQGEIANYFISTIDVTDERNRDHEMSTLNKEISIAQKQINRYDSQLSYLLKNSNMYAWRLDFHNQTITYTRSLSAPEHVITFDDYYDRTFDEEKAVALKGLQTPEMWDHSFDLVRHFRKPLFGDGDSDHWYNITGIPIHDSEGKVVATFGILHDITDTLNTQRHLKEETERAENSGQQKSMFLASMTHELRTPLNSIVGFSDLLRTIDVPEERKEFIHIIRTNCDILLRLINDILEASTLSEAPMDIRPKDIDFAKDFNEICLTLSQRIKNSDVKFVKKNPHTKLLTHLDIDRIQQVMTNLFTNASKYTQQGHICLGYRLDQRHGRQGIYVYCEDTGIGIPKEKIASVFERFVKLNDFVQGTGLGLAICKSIVELCHGEIGAESEVGKGSTFWFWIPAKVKEIAPTPSAYII